MVDPHRQPDSVSLSAMSTCRAVGDEVLFTTAVVASSSMWPVAFPRHARKFLFQRRHPID